MHTESWKSRVLSVFTVSLSSWLLANGVQSHSFALDICQIPVVIEDVATMPEGAGASNLSIIGSEMGHCAAMVTNWVKRQEEYETTGAAPENASTHPLWAQRQQISKETIYLSSDRKSLRLIKMRWWLSRNLIIHSSQSPEIFSKANN